MRVHDAVQVCLQHVQNLNESPKNHNIASEDKLGFFRRLMKQREDDKSIRDLESGENISSNLVDVDPQLEPLLDRKS